MKFFPVILTTPVAFAALTAPANAYLDPGTGSMILQGIIGALAIGMASLSVFWSRVKNFFAPKDRSTDELEPTDEKSKLP